MQDIQQTIDEYRQSCDQILRRIHALNDQINGRAACGNTPPHLLMRRRKLLYTELAEMQASICEMEEYIEAAATRHPLAS